MKKKQPYLEACRGSAVTGEEDSFRPEIDQCKAVIVLWQVHHRFTKNHRFYSINSQFKFLLSHIEHAVLSKVGAAL